MMDGVVLDELNRSDVLRNQATLNVLCSGRHDKPYTYAQARSI
jgi:hypothetical protein